MRNFSKTLISMAAVMAVGSAMAAGAMAADLTIGQDTLKTDGKISISGVTTTDTKGNALTQYTLLVVQGTEGEKGVEYIISDGSAQGTTCTIKQIDQDDTGKAFTEAVLGTDLADGSYKVMIGNNDGTVDSGIFEVSSAPVVEYRDYIIGDINDDKRVLTNDATYLKKKLAKKTEGIALAGTEFVRDTGVKLIVGDINDDKRVLTNDATYLKKKLAKKTEGIALAGTTVKVVK